MIKKLSRLVAGLLLVVGVGVVSAPQASASDSTRESHVVSRMCTHTVGVDTEQLLYSVYWSRKPGYISIDRVDIAHLYLNHQPIQMLREPITVAQGGKPYRSIAGTGVIGANDSFYWPQLWIAETSVKPVVVSVGGYSSLLSNRAVVGCSEDTYYWG